MDVYIFVRVLAFNSLGYVCVCVYSEAEFLDHMVINHTA